MTSPPRLILPNVLAILPVTSSLALGFYPFYWPLFTRFTNWQDYHHLTVMQTNQDIYGLIVNCQNNHLNNWIVNQRLYICTLTGKKVLWRSAVHCHYKVLVSTLSETLIKTGSHRKCLCCISAIMLRCIMQQADFNWFLWNLNWVNMQIRSLTKLLINRRPWWLSWMCVWLETRRSGVGPPPRSATFFHGDWSWNNFYGHSLRSADSRRAVVSFWWKNVHNTG